jgi:hypothetical protein
MLGSIDIPKDWPRPPARWTRRFPTIYSAHGMTRRFLLSLAAVVVTVMVSVCAGSASAAQAPQWVTAGVQTLRAHFHGNPEPARVTWGTHLKRRWVTIYLAQAHRVYSHGPRGSIVTGSRATITWDLSRPELTYNVRIR